MEGAAESTAESRATEELGNAGSKGPPPDEIVATQAVDAKTAVGTRRRVPSVLELLTAQGAAAAEGDRNGMEIAAEKAAADKAAAEKAAAEKASAEKTPADRAAAEKASAERTAAEKTAAEKAVAEKAAAGSMCDGHCAETSGEGEGREVDDRR